MNVMTKYHGEMTITENDIWKFPNGLPGFLDEHEFTLYHLNEQGVFSILQSVVNKEVAFIVANPFAFFKDYDFVLDESSIAGLKIESDTDVLPYVILTLGDTLFSSTANLLAPLVFNVKKKLAKQVILHDTKYHAKHLIQQEEVK